MFGNKRIRELESDVLSIGARLAEAEARVAGLVKLAGANEQLDQRFAQAIDEIELRQANGLHTINAAFAGLSRRVEALGKPEAGSLPSLGEPVPAAPPSDPNPNAAGSPSLASIDGAVVRGAPIPEPAE